jgi:hypothetical protein
MKNIEFLRAWVNGETVQVLIDGEWRDHNHHSAHKGAPAFHDAHTFRIKPKTININGHEVPEPCREPLNKNEEYWIVEISSLRTIWVCHWYGSDIDHQLLDRGLIHKTEEAAEAHAKALLTFTTNED